mgnify:CR=1 FL=1
MDIDTLMKISQGNAGALSALYFLDLKYFPILEELNIVGCKIWMLYKDVCDKEIKQMEELLDKLEKDGDVEMSIRGKNSVMEYLNSYPPYRENSNHNEREELVTNSSSESSNCNPLIIGDRDRNPGGFGIGGGMNVEPTHPIFDRERSDDDPSIIPSARFDPISPFGGSGIGPGRGSGNMPINPDNDLFHPPQ